MMKRADFKKNKIASLPNGSQACLTVGRRINVLKYKNFRYEQLKGEMYVFSNS
jgi:hypothetical protein